MDSSEINEKPTPYPAVNAVLRDVLKDFQSVLESRLMGMYLEGSLANGGFDEDSDIDFVTVTVGEISKNIFSKLYAMLERINRSDSRWPVNLEGSYISKYALRRFDPKHANYPDIERGFGERLKMVYHGKT
ncbi:MAG: nucleotidyltransferase domain-containing protein [Bacteroidota bacterium]